MCRPTQLKHPCRERRSYCSHPPILDYIERSRKSVDDPVIFIIYHYSDMHITIIVGSKEF